MENKESFNYTYSAKEQAEIKAIRRKYTAPEQDENKMERLRRLDAAVTKKAASASLTMGVIGTLVMGSGMSLVMTDIGKTVGLDGGMAMLIGIPVGIFGIALICGALPLYQKTLRRERKRIAPEIIKLSDELMKR